MLASLQGLDRSLLLLITAPLGWRERRKHPETATCSRDGMSSRTVGSHEAVGSAQVAKSTEAELLAMSSITCRACREMPQDIIYSNQPLLKKFCCLKIP